MQFRLHFIALILLSFAVFAATVGTITHDPAVCTSDGLTAQSLGTGYVDFNGDFVSAPPPSGTIHYECVEGGDERAANTSAQIVKRTNLVVKNHLYDDMLYHFSGLNVAGENKAAASSDSNNNMPDDFWGEASSTEISDDGGPQSDTDIYQFVAGVDKLVGNFIFGAALTYAHTEDEFGKQHDTGDTVGITPYVAYKITDYLFASTLVSYNYTHTNRTRGQLDMDSDDFISETNINLFKVIDSFVLKGRAGVRYKHTDTELENSNSGRDSDYDELTWIGDVEFGYQFENKLHIFTGFLYEYYDREASAVSAKVGDGIGFMRYGAEYPVYKTLTVGAKLEHDINDNDYDYMTGSINARLAF